MQKRILKIKTLPKCDLLFGVVKRRAFYGYSRVDMEITAFDCQPTAKKMKICSLQFQGVTKAGGPTSEPSKKKDNYLHAMDCGLIVQAMLH